MRGAQKNADSCDAEHIRKDTQGQSGAATAAQQREQTGPMSNSLGKP